MFTSYVKNKDSQDSIIFGDGNQGKVKGLGKIAISNYRVIVQVEGYSLVEVAIETGRTHQIRVHMKSINHVILGDSTYGSEDKNVKRQMLHAYKLEFLNPLDNKEYIFKGRLFDDFIEVAKRLKFNIEKYSWYVGNYG